MLYQRDTIFHRASALAANYIAHPLTGRRSTSSFWYLPDPPNVYDGASLQRYLKGAPSPRYLIDYRTRAQFPLAAHPSGILTLPYPQPIGEQINPEAAFQYALGWHDMHVRDHMPGSLEIFLKHASYFKGCQVDEGDFTYNFDWFENKAPWHSALAQSRGASVMMRAYLLTGDKSYAVASRRAIQRFQVPCDIGGYKAIFPLTNTVYFEEYPTQRNAVINGFMATLIGLFDVSCHLKYGVARDLFEEGLRSLEVMLPHYTTKTWTLYDRFGPDDGANVHSPRYQTMVINYLTVLSEIAQSETIREYQKAWLRMNTPSNRLRAYALKARRKLLYR